MIRKYTSIPDPFISENKKLNSWPQRQNLKLVLLLYESPYKTLYTFQILRYKFEKLYLILIFIFLVNCDMKVVKDPSPCKQACTYQETLIGNYFMYSWCYWQASAWFAPQGSRTTCAASVAKDINRSNLSRETWSLRLRLMSSVATRKRPVQVCWSSRIFQSFISSALNALFTVSSLKPPTLKFVNNSCYLMYKLPLSYVDLITYTLKLVRAAKK